jgi:hypothetical protein
MPEACRALNRGATGTVAPAERFRRNNESRGGDMTDTTPTQLLVQANLADTMKVDSRDGDHIGVVHAFMTHKGSGRVTHAVLSLGGFLGMGKSFYPLPFALLQFDPVRDLYVVTIDRRMLEGGPSWANNAPDFDQAYADRVARYYEVPGETLANG